MFPYMTEYWSDLSEALELYIRCVVCREPLEVRLTKVGKPYAQCLDCGVQIFVRGRSGIARLRADAITVKCPECKEPAYLLTR